MILTGVTPSKKKSGNRFGQSGSLKTVNSEGPMQTPSGSLHGMVYSSVLKKMAARNPNRVDRPVIGPPFSNASGNMVSAIMVSMAPAAIPSIRANRE